MKIQRVIKAFSYDNFASVLNSSVLRDRLEGMQHMLSRAELTFKQCLLLYLNFTKDNKLQETKKVTQS